jgi:hypothetical protein
MENDAPRRMSEDVNMTRTLRNDPRDRIELVLPNFNEL